MRWPGLGTYKTQPGDVRPFTIHEFVKPTLAKMPEKPASNWAQQVREELSALAEAPDRDVTADDLGWAASARCRCGAGYAYPKFLHDPHGHWFCSATLLGTAPVGTEHDCAKPFAFWDIKSDQQPSAGGATTRPRTSE